MPRVGNVGDEPRTDDVLRRPATEEKHLRVDIAQRSEGAPLERAGQIEAPVLEQKVEGLQATQIAGVNRRPGLKQAVRRVRAQRLAQEFGAQISHRPEIAIALRERKNAGLTDRAA